VKKGVTRAYWLVLCLIMFAISHLAFWIFTERWMIPFVALITGLAYGGTHPPQQLALSSRVGPSLTVCRACRACRVCRVVLAGFFAVVPILISLYFGFTHFGKNNSCAALAPAIGSFGFSAFLFSPHTPHTALNETHHTTHADRTHRTHAHIRTWEADRTHWASQQTTWRRCSTTATRRATRSTASEATAGRRSSW
jgi:hypothetical protein